MPISYAIDTGIDDRNGERTAELAGSGRVAELELDGVRAWCGKCMCWLRSSTGGAVAKRPQIAGGIGQRALIRKGIVQAIFGVCHRHKVGTGDGTLGHGCGVFADIHAQTIEAHIDTTAIGCGWHCEGVLAGVEWQ